MVQTALGRLLATSFRLMALTQTDLAKHPYWN